jgi:demethylmenaquinone methyltransferase/2-methoxy-6-polyprenyl-1,4-benzoquinol methylase
LRGLASTVRILRKVLSCKAMQKEYIRSLFDNIAYRYDLLNHLLSGGVDLYWRWKAIQTLAQHHPKRILDVATGTADFAIAALRLNPEKVIGVDISEPMLEVGRVKIAKQKLNGKIQLQSGEAENLMFGAASFDAAIVAFGARNFEHLDKGLSEMYRVLRTGGKIVVLEFSRPKMFPFRQLYFFYFKNILPIVGRMISKDKEAYQYLPDTVMKFPEGDDFLIRLSNAGFSAVKQERLTFGIATIYTGIK